MILALSLSLSIVKGIVRVLFGKFKKLSCFCTPGPFVVKKSKCYIDNMKDKSKRFFGLMKRYGPGFVALSKTSGRVGAHGRDIKEMWQRAEKKKVDFTKITVTHVPKYGSLSLYFRAQK